MSRLLRALLVLAVCGLTLTRHALARGPLELHASISSDTVAVGEAFVVELSAMSEERTSFSDPLLRLPNGLSASGPSMGSKTLVQMGATGTMFRRGVSVKWRLTASAPGRYTIAPPSLRVDGRTVAADAALRVTVVDASQRPPQRANPLDPFGMGSPFDDPFDGLFKDAQPKRQGDLIVDEPVPDLDALGEGGKRLALRKGDDPYLFLRVVADKSRVVVGEQVTLRFFEYYRVTNERFDERQPPLTDFLRVPLDDEPGQTPRVATGVGGRLWFVQELDRVAVFPLRAGSLSTGKLRASFRVPFLKNQTVTRESNDLAIEVREPPGERRPVGYRVGDVGRFELTATVTPRQTVAGETVAVSVKVEGRGVMPNQLKLPERTGVEWLSPEKQDTSDVQSGRIGGSRTFGYAVRVTEVGEVDLGLVELPFFDPDKREYRVARAVLGSIAVKPKAGGAKAEKAGAAEEDPFAAMPKARLRLGAYHRSAAHAPPLGWSLGLLAAPTLALLAARLGARALRAFATRRLARRSDPETLARRSLEELAVAADASAAAGLADRAVHHAIEAGTRLRSRGILLDGLAAELARRGLPPTLAAEAQAVLALAERLRFDPAPGATERDELVRRARAVTKELLALEVEGAP